MAIDYVIDYDCVPKQTMGTMGIIERLKGQERADAIIALFRQNDDQRDPSEMGFEMVRTAADGSEETQIVVVQHLLDSAEELEPLAPYCVGCPANRAGKPFGCIDHISYPITGKGEAWLLNQLPRPDEPLIWLLLREGIEKFHYDGSTVRELRSTNQNLFEEERTIYRRLGEISVTSDQLFEMTFLLGNVQPNHAGILLLFFAAIDRENMEAPTIMGIGELPTDDRVQYPFLIEHDKEDDPTTTEMKNFLAALYLAWVLNVQLLLDV